MSRKLYLMGLMLGLSISVASCSCGAGTSTPAKGPLDEARELALAGDLDAAEKIVVGLRDAEGLTPETALLLGGIYEARPDLSKAVSIYRKAAEEFPGSGKIETRLGEVFLSLGQIEAGLKRFKKARAAGVADSEVALSMSIAYGLLEKFPEAAAELDLAEQAGAPVPTVQYNRGLLYRQSGDKVGSRDLFLAAHEGRPDDSSILRELARAELLLVEGRDLEAIARAEAYINESISLVDKQGRADWRGYDVLGDCFMARDDWAAASEMYLQAKEIGQEPDPGLDDKYYEAQVKLRGLESGGEE